MIDTSVAQSKVQEKEDLSNYVTVDGIFIK